MNEQKPSQILNIPTAIIVAGALVAGAFIYTMKPVPTTATNAANASSSQTELKPVTADDHILGNPDAKIKIVEYSDPSCPFCKMFHSTMRQVMDTYGKSGDVAWVYRHYTLDKPDATGHILHPNAGHEAQALECAADLGGNDKFWAFANRLYDITPSVTPDTPNGLDQTQLPVIAKYVGLDVQSFNDCLSSGKFANKVEQEFTDGVNLGIQGTPTSFLITPAGKIIAIEGAQTYDNLKQAIDALLSDNSGGTTGASDASGILDQGQGQ